MGPAQYIYSMAMAETGENHTIKWGFMQGNAGSNLIRDDNQSSDMYLRRAARKVLNMRITPRPEVYLVLALRAASDLGLRGPPLMGPSPYQA